MEGIAESTPSVPPDGLARTGPARRRRPGLAPFCHRNGLSLALLALLLACLAGQILAGHRVNNEDLLQHGAEPLSLLAYLHSGDFLSATFENWESEFLQMGVYVLMTAHLRQRGSAESLPLEPSDEPRCPVPARRAPWPVRRGGWWLRLYENSLGIAFFALFALSFIAHLLGSWTKYGEAQRLHGGDQVALWQYLLQAQPWFESFQNWQSEFLAVLSLVLLTIFLRQKGSPQSKPVDAPHGQTGG